jgi:hypothetical protein
MRLIRLPAITAHLLVSRVDSRSSGRAKAAAEGKGSRWAMGAANAQDTAATGAWELVIRTLSATGIAKAKFVELEQRASPGCPLPVALNEEGPSK